MILDLDKDSLNFMIESVRIRLFGTDDPPTTDELVVGLKAARCLTIFTEPGRPWDEVSEDCKFARETVAKIESHLNMRTSRK